MDAAAIVEGLVGLPVWSAVVGPAGQYVLSLELGEQKRRPVRLANPRLSFVKRTFEGSYALLVECPWRVEGPRGLLASAFDAFEPEAIVGEHPVFADAKVEAVELDARTGDLAISLGEERVLRAIALETRVEPPQRVNWTLTTPEQVLSSGPCGRLSLRSRAEAEGAFRRMIRAMEGEDDDVVSRLSGRRKPPAEPTDDA